MNLDKRLSLHTLSHSLASYARSEIGTWAGHYFHDDGTAAPCLRLTSGLSRFAGDCPAGYRPRYGSGLEPTYHDMDACSMLADARLDCEILLRKGDRMCPALRQCVEELHDAIVSVGNRFFAWELDPNYLTVSIAP